MPRPDDLAHFAPDERLDELTDILAAGLARLPARCHALLARRDDPASPNFADSTQKALEVSRDSSLHRERG